MEDVPLIDMTGLVAMKNMILDVQRNHRTVILCGKPDITDKILQKLPLSAEHKMKVTQTVEEAVSFTANRTETP